MLNIGVLVLYTIAYGLTASQYTLSRMQMSLIKEALGRITARSIIRRIFLKCWRPNVGI